MTTTRKDPNVTNLQVITIKKREMISTLKKNYEKYQKLRIEELKGYKQESETQLKNLINDYEKEIENIQQHKKEAEESLKNLSKTDPKDIDSPIHKSLATWPVGYSIEYETVIGMLEMAQENTVELDVADYRKYVNNEWEWKDRFVQNLKGYYGPGGNQGTQGNQGSNSSSSVMSLVKTF